MSLVAVNNDYRRRLGKRNGQHRRLNLGNVINKFMPCIKHDNICIPEIVRRTKPFFVNPALEFIFQWAKWPIYRSINIVCLCRFLIKEKNIFKMFFRELVYWIQDFLQI